MPGPFPVDRKTPPCWMMITDALRGRRKSKGLTQAELAELADLDEKTIREHEKRGAQAPQPGTLARLAKALGCAETDLAYFDDDPDATARDPVRRRALERGLPPPAPGALPAPNLVRTGPDPKYAQREAQLGLDKTTVEVRGEEYRLVGYACMLELQMRYGMLKGPFVVMGVVHEVKEIPSEAAFLLNAQQGLGATYARIRRFVPGLAENGDDVPFETTVYSPKGAHGTRLHACFNSGAEVKVIVKVVARPQRETRRTFPTLSNPVVERPWALVATQVYTDQD